MNPTELYEKILGVAMIARNTITPSRFRAIVLPTVDALIETIKLHEPVPCAPGSVIMDCHGCDVGPHADFNAEAPCSTLLTIATALGVEQ